MTYKKKTLVSSFALAAAAGAIGVGVASAHFGPNGEGREAVHDAVRNNNFKAFGRAMDNMPNPHKVDTKREFDAIALSYDLRQDGKYKEAREVLERAGIEHPGYNRRHRRDDTNMRSIIENNDWNKFQDVAKGKRIADTVNTRDKFNLFKEAHELHKKGRHEEAREIMEELGMHHMK